MTSSLIPTSPIHTSTQPTTTQLNPGLFIPLQSFQGDLLISCSSHIRNTDKYTTDDYHAYTGSVNSHSLFPCKNDSLMIVSTSDHLRPDKHAGRHKSIPSRYQYSPLFSLRLNDLSHSALTTIGLTSRAQTSTGPITTLINEGLHILAKPSIIRTILRVQ